MFNINSNFILPCWKWLKSVVKLFDPKVLFIDRLKKNCSWACLYWGVVDTFQKQLITLFSSAFGGVGQL